MQTVVRDRRAIVGSPCTTPRQRECDDLASSWLEGMLRDGACVRVFLATEGVWV
jgi:hypothetical protein